MRTLVAIFLILAGCGAVAYSYVGGLVTLAGEAERSVMARDPVSAAAMIMSLIVSGEIPQLTAFLYLGALLISLGVVALIVRGRANGR